MAKYVIQTTKGTAPQGAYSQGWRAGDFIFVTGTGPLDAKTGKLAGESIEEQTEQVISNMESVLAADHATLADVVKVTVHLSDTALFARYNAVYARRFAAPYPVRTTVGSDLRQLPGMLIEADCIAYLPQTESNAKPRARSAKRSTKKKTRRAR
ncbi:MAG TPA: Rid family hydrolase [Candidatus Sulfotelmatobacter sp.]|jgi:2-iminobutanoate/2-iminopropanoate deaminase